MRAVVLVEYDLDEPSISERGSLFLAIDALRERLPHTEGAQVRQMWVGIHEAADRVLAAMPDPSTHVEVES